MPRASQFNATTLRDYPQLDLVERVMELAERAMAAEGIPSSTRERVRSTVLFGHPYGLDGLNTVVLVGQPPFEDEQGGAGGDQPGPHGDGPCSAGEEADAEDGQGDRL
jgi:hypothetical protein